MLICFNCIQVIVREGMERRLSFLFENEIDFKINKSPMSHIALDALFAQTVLYILKEEGMKHNSIFFFILKMKSISIIESRKESSMQSISTSVNRKRGLTNISRRPWHWFCCFQSCSGNGTRYSLRAGEATADADANANADADADANADADADRQQVVSEL